MRRAVLRLCPAPLLPARRPLAPCAALRRPCRAVPRRHGGRQACRRAVLAPAATVLAATAELGAAAMAPPLRLRCGGAAPSPLLPVLPAASPAVPPPPRWLLGVAAGPPRRQQQRHHCRHGWVKLADMPGCCCRRWHGRAASTRRLRTRRPSGRRSTSSSPSLRSWTGVGKVTSPSVTSFCWPRTSTARPPTAASVRSCERHRCGEATIRRPSLVDSLSVMLPTSCFLHTRMRWRWYVQLTQTKKRDPCCISFEIPSLVQGVASAYSGTQTRQVAPA
mmetsp:Transcript_16914/g.43077  ORF Transcript_16914/g.43077 Transcript_16914/m.43077 type:complete len:277 (-) Transcript_16914:651-1481(-)